MLQINPKKFKAIKNKTIPNPLRPKFRNNNQSNIYFLSQRKFNEERKNSIIQKTKIAFVLFFLIIGGYFITN